MLPKEHRLKNNFEFRRVKTYGNSILTPYFILLYYQNRNSKGAKQPSRYGFIASKKFDKRAVVRNRARRLLRETIRQHLPNLKDNYDIVLIAKRPIKDASFQEVNASFNKILPKVPFA